jgi:hypothetical protein
MTVSEDRPGEFVPGRLALRTDVVEPGVTREVRGAARISDAAAPAIARVQFGTPR